MPEQPKAALMQRLRALRQAEGWVRVEVWIPAALVPKLRAWVKRATSSAAVKGKK